MHITRATSWLLAVVLLSGPSCSDDGSTGALATGLAGSVTRGPITPVCGVTQPCDAPFAAHFSVRQGNRTVAAFESDAAGNYEVRLAPGGYTVVPGNDAPIISPTMQAKAVTVGPTGLTVANLSFDTGIR